MQKIVTGLGIVFVFMFAACKKQAPIAGHPYKPNGNIDSFISAMDVSSLSMVLRQGEIFKDEKGNPVTIFPFLKSKGINSLRFRVWVGNDPNYQSDSILKLVNLARKEGLLIWIDLHYSNTWADPGNQQIPKEWDQSNLKNLGADLKSYTERMLQTFNPDMIQLGNEIDGGFLWPKARISDTSAFYSLLRLVSKTTRDFNAQIPIMYHISNYQKADYFYNELDAHGVNYDMIGLSYYPKWHGYNTDSLFQTMDRLHANHGKRVIIAENSYPFTLSWADWTDNVMGWEGDLHPNYPASTNGQYEQVHHLIKGCRNRSFASGYAYWEGTWVAFDGPESKEGSLWENQACFDFAFKALPVLEAFKP